MLSQALLYDDVSLDPWADSTAPAGESGESVWSALSGRVDAFLAAYRQWTNAGGMADLDRMRADLQSARATFAGRLAECERAGDTAGAEALRGHITDTDSTLTSLDDLQSRASNYSSTWDVLARWISSFTSFFGLGVGPILLGIGAAVAVAAVSAMSYFITDWLAVRERVSMVKDLADKLASGALTTAQVSSLVASVPASGGGWFSGIGVGAIAAIAVVGLLMLRGK
jgi:hypothetical protein